MRKKLIIIAATVIVGFLSGYYSDPAAKFFTGLEFPRFGLKEIFRISVNEASKAAGQKSVSDRASTGIPAGAITGDAAVDAVKAIPAVKQLVSSAASRGFQVSFRADQSPTREYPVWLVELRQVYPNQIPDIMFLKVDSQTGKVLDIQKEELQIAGFKLASPVPAGTGTGKPVQIKSVYNESLKRKVRIEKYKGFEVESDLNKELIRITVTGNGIQGPRGLTVGADFGDVVKKFGKANIAQEDLLIFNALDDKNLQFHVKISSGKVSTFSMVKHIQ